MRGAVFLSIVLIFVAAVSGLLAIVTASLGWKESTRPRPMTRLTLQFRDAQEAQTAVDVLVARLDRTVAQESKVRVGSGGDVHVQFVDQRSVGAEWREIDESATSSGTVKPEHEERYAFLSQRGELRVYWEPLSADFERAGTRERAERERFREWRRVHADVDVAEFDALAPGAGGPNPGFAWVRGRTDTEGAERVEPVLLTVPDESWHFDASRPISVRTPWNRQTSPYVTLELDEPRAACVRALGASSESRNLAFVLDGERIGVASVPKGTGRELTLRGGEGDYSTGEVDHVARMLRAGTLPSRPKLTEVRFVAGNYGMLVMVYFGMALVAASACGAALTMAIWKLRSASRPASAVARSDADPWR